MFVSVFKTQGGLDDEVLRAGLNKLIDIRLARKEITKNASIMHAVDADDQLKIELPLITSASDIFQGKEWWFLSHYVCLLDSNTNITAPCFYFYLIIANFYAFLCGMEKCQVIKKCTAHLFPCSYNNDDSVSQINVGLTCPVDYSFITENSPPEPQMLGIIIGNKMPLLVTVDYFLKPGKTGDALTKLFMQHLKIS